MTTKSETTVLNIVEQHLKGNGFDGLYQPDRCSCDIGDLSPGDCLDETCIAGYQCACNCDEPHRCDHHIGPEKGLTP